MTEQPTTPIKKNDERPKAPVKENDERPKAPVKENDERPKAPKYKNPKSESRLKLVGYFSVDGDRNFLPDSSRLLYFNPPNEADVYLDLDDGIESAVRRKASFKEEGIDLLLEWLKLNYGKLRANPSGGRFLQPKFICTRGSLTRIFTTQCKPNEGWVTYAAKWKGSIYLCCDKTEYQYESKENDKMSSWGHKFEQYVFSAAPGTPPDTTGPVIEPAEFRCVYQRRIGNHPVLFSAVMKGVLSDTVLKDPLPLQKGLKFVETKTHKILEHGGHEKALRRNKLPRWWAQCYLTDTEELLVGFRDQSGVVQQLKIYSVADMAAMAKPHWDPSACEDFCKSFLETIAESVTLDCDESIYRFEKIPNQGINITTLSSAGQYGFIPESFMEAF